MTKRQKDNIDEEGTKTLTVSENDKIYDLKMNESRNVEWEKQKGKNKNKRNKEPK